MRAVGMSLAGCTVSLAVADLYFDGKPGTSTVTVAKDYH